MGLTGADSATLDTKLFTPDAKTHSSSFDSKRGIIHLANLGENAVKFLRLVDGKLSEVGEYKVSAPRTVVFDPAFDRLYISTEVPNGTGEGTVKILSFDTDFSGNLMVREVGSFPVGDRGADIQVSSKNKLAVAAIRQMQKESLAIIPLNAKGELNPDSPGQPFPIPFAEPRSLRILGDGKTIFLTPNSDGSDVVIYSIQTDPTGKPRSLQLLKELDAGAESFPCNFSIDEFGE